MKVRVIIIGTLVIWALPLYASDSFAPDKPNSIEFALSEARFVRLVIRGSLQGQPCIDELEVYGPGGGANLALAGAGAKATASSCFAGYSIHQIAHLNDGLYGNRELLHLDPEIGSMSPTLLRPVAAPPVLGGGEAPAERSPSKGQFFVADVYRGLEQAVKRGTVKYIRVCREVRADLIRLPASEYQADHKPFQDWYATPTHKVNGPGGWPSYVAKGVLGIAPVEQDGSANFYAPAGKVLYFQVLDADYNEIQRMRSVVQLQDGEKRGCIGCHESRMLAPPSPDRIPIAMRREPSTLQPPPWGAGPFSYEKVVQPVWDAKCIRCHDAKDEQQINLTGILDADRIPASYRTIITKGWVHYFDYTWGREHSKAEPLSFGTVKSKLWDIMEDEHYDVRLTTEEARRIKCWTDLNCPLWPDYIFRPDRLAMETEAR